MTTITGPTFRGFTDAYRAVLAGILEAPRYRTSTRAKTAVETPNVSFTLLDPVVRMPLIAARKANVVFNHAEALWYLMGRDDLDMIGYYAPSLRPLSADGERLTGTAYGPRLFQPDGEDRRSQFTRVMALLRRDPDTKRAALLIMRPDELVDPDNPDVACTLGLQLMLREGELHMSAFMRGNDAVIGLLGDTFAFTFIQEFAARQLDVEVGTYAHHVGSMHINVNHLDQVAAILAEPDGPTFPRVQMPKTSWIDLADIGSWEERLRRDHARFDRDDCVGIDPYWAQVIALFEVYRQIVHCPGQRVTVAALEMLRPDHRWLVTHRWPSRMPEPVTA
ncbi:thymidylate synthase [Asanoa ferruginea]|uniref:thymidylate synthase n=1 Tax=Asanoa ferruginea TaxID=53367 RepID=A0A3D9ZUV0_9ACTN|nr:thymidylate synthase [Asanoa ferruginea]REG00948.1 thymidylate synthase [Asanoa ferruginea]GIF47546.1 thymidylate synthase [Asanoa ferruginea]